MSGKETTGEKFFFFFFLTQEKQPELTQAVEVKLSKAARQGLKSPPG